MKENEKLIELITPLIENLSFTELEQAEKIIPSFLCDLMGKKYDPVYIRTFHYTPSEDEKIRNALTLNQLVEKKLEEKGKELEHMVKFGEGQKSNGSDYHLKILDERNLLASLLEQSKEKS